MLLNKKIRAGLLVTALIFQIAMWAVGFVMEQNRFADSFEIYIPVRVYDPYDRFRGAYVALQLDESRLDIDYDIREARGSAHIFYDINGDGVIYKALATDANKVDRTVSKWARNFEYRFSYYTDEYSAADIERRAWDGEELWAVFELNGSGDYRLVNLLFEHDLIDIG